MIHEVFPPLTETALGSHPYRVVSVTYRKLRPFHGGNTGSNPVGDANNPKHLSQADFRSNVFGGRCGDDRTGIAAVSRLFKGH